MNIIPPTEKNKILTVDVNDGEFDDDRDDNSDELYLQEKQSEYEDETVMNIQKAIMDYVEMKALTICEYLSERKIRNFLRYRK